MVQGIGYNGVFRAQQRLEHTAIGIKSSGVKDGIVHVQKVGECFFKAGVNVLRAANKAHRGHAIAVIFQRFLTRFHKLVGIGEAQIIVGAEVQHMVAGAILHHINFGILFGRDNALGFKELLVTNALKLVLDTT